MNEHEIIYYYHDNFFYKRRSFGKLSPFIMIFIINPKTPTMRALQFYKQALILTDSY